MRLVLVFISIVCFQVANSQQRVVAECTVTYKITMDDVSVDKDVLNTLKQSSKTIYIKGNDSRVDLISPTIKQSVIYDKTQKSAVVLREFGNNKFMHRLNQTKWIAANSQYEGSTIVVSNETKKILGYECKKAILQLKDGTSFVLYYALTIVPSVREFEYQFKDIPGFVLEYQIKEQGSERMVNYQADKISLSPVLASRFDIPVSGYRMLN